MSAVTAHIPTTSSGDTAEQFWKSIASLVAWLDAHDYRGYDTFDGLNARYLRPLTFESKFLRTVLQQTVRRFPLNLRPLLAIAPARSTKGMGYLGRGFLRLHQATGDAAWRMRAADALEWLIQNQSPGYSGACWGNHFDYQSRAFYLPKGVPTVVWTSLIGHAFLDGYDHFGETRYLDIALSSCEHILKDLDTLDEGDALCISYIPGQSKHVDNANTLGASLLARTFSYTGTEQYRRIAEKAMRYTARRQRPDRSWFYGEAANLHWVDNFHTAYVLDCFEHYSRSTGDTQFDRQILDGYGYWKNTFFLPDGTPKYYNHKILPLDIQCCSQAIDTLVFFSGRDPEALTLARRIAGWTIRNMQDRSGYFYYRRYSPWLVNKTPTMHWGQATMLSALGALYLALQRQEFRA